MQAEWNQAFPSPPQFSGPIIGGVGVPNRPAWLEASMMAGERERQETAWRALQEIYHYRPEVLPTSRMRTEHMSAC
jgi:hypothetical protein